MGKSLMWVSFLVIVLALLVLDLGVFNKKDHKISFKQSIGMSIFYISIAMIFGLWILYRLGINSFADYLTGFLVEKSLSLDNIFVISMVFTALSIPSKYQHRILFFGVLGVIILRGLLIGLGAKIIAEFNWVLYIFSIFLILIGFKMFLVSKPKVNLNKNILLRWMRKHIRITKKLHGNRFFVLKSVSESNQRKLFITPLLVALVMIECVDLIFALDSVPAIFTITQDTYIVYTSNIFAILGLRALYFTLASMVDQFHYLQHALAMVLIFIGSKIFIVDIFGKQIPSVVSLIITISLLGVGYVLSVFKPKNRFNI